MQEKNWFSSSLDVVAILALVGTVIALGSAYWLTDVIPELLLFKIFHSCLAIAIVSFSVSRLAQIARVISSTPAPKLQRSVVVNEVAMDDVSTDGKDVVAEGKFPRAA